ncbi:hypothetical protein L4C34_14765 [Vibrio profundum]
MNDNVKLIILVSALMVALVGCRVPSAEHGEHQAMHDLDSGSSYSQNL